MAEEGRQDDGGCLERTAAKERIQNTERWWSRDYCLRSGGRGPPPTCDTSFLQGCRECEALLGEEREQIASEGGTPTAKLGVPFHRHGFVTN